MLVALFDEGTECCSSGNVQRIMFAMNKIWNNGDYLKTQTPVLWSIIWPWL